ncbi:MAG: nicotinamidase [Nitrospinota bacterium]
MAWEIGPQDALIVVDVQRDFCPGGALAVPDGDQVVEPINRLLARGGWFVVATRDEHPPDHISFKDRGGPWPPHCVKGRPGWEFHPDLGVGRVDLVVAKGTRPDAEAYSGFQGTDLARQLAERSIRRVFVCGLATDYCVRATALDARAAGLEVVVVEDAIRGVEVHPGDCAKAREEMSRAGCGFATSREL